MLHFEKEVKDRGSEIPLIKNLCGAHRSDLAWGDASQKIRYFHKIISTLSDISSHFHQSAMRTDKLKQIASAKNLKLM